MMAAEKRNKRRRRTRGGLTPKQIKFVKAKAAGKSNVQAAMEATGLTNPGSAAVAADRMLKNDNVQEAVQQALAARGITIDAAIAPIADGLEASREIFNKDGDLITETPDHNVRLKAAGMALDLLGAKKATPEAGTVNFNFNQIVEKDRNEFGF